MTGWIRAVDGEVGSLVGTAGSRAQQVRGDAQLVHHQDRLALGPAGAVPVVELVVVGRALDDEHAGHAVRDIDCRRAVLVRVIPVRAGGLAHLDRAGRDRLRRILLRNLEAVGIRPDVELRPEAHPELILCHRPQRLQVRVVFVMGLQQQRLLAGPGLRVGRAAARRIGARRIIPRPERCFAPGERPFERRVALQLVVAGLEEIVERFRQGLVGDRRLAIHDRRRPDFEKDIVAGPVRIGVRAVEVDVAGARSVEAIGEHIVGRGRITRCRAVAATAALFSPPDPTADHSTTRTDQG